MHYMQAAMEKIFAHLSRDNSTTPQQHHNEYEEIDYEDGDNLKEHQEDKKL